MDETTIKIDKKTQKALKVWCAKNEMTYDEAINAFLKQEADFAEDEAINSCAE